jgi:hypothetical protein
MSMTSQKDRKLYELSDKVREFSKPVNWLAQYDEEDDFLCDKVSHPLSEFKEEQ